MEIMGKKYEDNLANFDEKDREGILTIIQVFEK